MKDIASFAIVSIVFGLGALTFAAAPQIGPDHEGLAECVKIHPSRYCRIANGFPVSPLP